MAAKARLAREYVRSSMRLYRETRSHARRLLEAVRAQGYRAVRLEGEPGNDLVDVCRLTCLEMGVRVASREEAKEVPTLRVEGTDVRLEWPEKEAGRS